MKILMLSVTFPYPPARGGTQVRTFNLLKYLSQRHPVTLVTQTTGDVTPSQIEELRHSAAEVVIFPRPSPAKPSGIIGKVRRFSQFWQQGTPPSVLSSYSLTMQGWIDEFVAAGNCEAITCEHSVNEIYVRPQWQQQIATVVNVHSSVYGTCQQQIATGTAEKPLRDRLNLSLLRRYEQNYCAKFSSIVVTTEEDKKYLQALHSTGNIDIIPNGVDLQLFSYRAADPGGHCLIFMGAMDNLPNIDAACFLSLEILPRVQQDYPDTTLKLVGARPVPQVLALQKCPGVEVVGWVPSMAEALHQGTVCVIPMRIGLGIKNKTLEAMATGVPIVASDRGLEGLAVDSAGGPLRALRANSVQEYVKAIHRLFEDPTLRAELSRNGRNLVETTYTWDSMGQNYEAVILRR